MVTYHRLAFPEARALTRKGIPQLTRHPHSDRGRVRLNRTDHYVGPWPDGEEDAPAETRRAYDELIARWLTGGRQPLDTPEQAKRKALAGRRAASADAGPSVAQVIASFLAHADVYYRRPDGSPTGEAENFVYALRPLNHLFGDHPAGRIGARQLLQVRELMVAGYLHPEYGPQRQLSRKLINQRVAKIARVFRWAAGKDMVPAAVHLALSAVESLKAGRSEARETEKVVPVSVADVEATLPKMRPQPAAAVRLQLLTGMRPGEALRLRACDLCRSGEVWIYRPPAHKTTHREKARAVAIGPKAQAVLEQFIRIRCEGCGAEGRPPRLGSPDGRRCGRCADRAERAGVCGPWRRVEVDAGRPLFSPRDEREERHQDARAARKGKVPPSQRSRRRPRPARPPGDRYTPTAYGNAVKRAARKAGVPEWHPNQLRHAHATLVRRLFGLEAAQAALGHSKADVTQLYAERDLALAASVALKVG